MDTLMRHQRDALLQHIAEATLLRSESGSTTIEFAVVIPVILLLLIGSMVAMLGLLAFGNATYATGVAARYATLHSNQSDAPATTDTIAAEALTHLWIAGQHAQINTTWSAGNLPGSSVNVKTVLSLPLGVPFTNVHQITVTTSAVRVVLR